MSTTQAPPDPETIRRTTTEVLAGAEFRIEQDTGMGETLVELLIRIGEWLIYPFRWLFNAMEGLPDGMRWVVVIGLVILLIALVGHLLYTLVTVLRPTTRRAKFESALSSKKQLNAKDFEQLAQEAFEQRDYIAAVRFLFRASLAHLQKAEGRPFSPGLTNRQYVRRYRKSPFVGALQAFVDIIDASWYGNGLCREEEYLRCREAYAEIQSQSKAGKHADRS